MASFTQFGALLQRLADTRGNKAKSALFADWLRRCASAEEASQSARWAAARPFEGLKQPKTPVSPALTAKIASSLCKIDLETEFATSKNALGSTTETIEKLLEAVFCFEKPLPEEVDFTLAQDWFYQLATLKKADAKEAFLTTVFQKLHPVALKYFLRIAGQRSLRIGFEERSILQAIAQAFEKPFEDVQKAWLYSGDVGRTAALAFNNTLNEASFALFHPIPFMLAAPYEAAGLPEGVDFVAEYKFDGMRAQIHVGSGKCAIFTRDLNEVSASFPDLSNLITAYKDTEAVFDGEIFVADENGIPVFNALQQRLGVKNPKADLLEANPASFVAYDLLFADRKPLMDLPWRNRRQQLEAVAARFGIPVSRYKAVQNDDEIRVLFETAKQHGHEGLMLKSVESVYEAGQRRKTWMKVKEPEEAITTVILYAHAGSGKRGGTYSDFTLGVRTLNAPDAPFVPIGKAYGGYSNEELAQLNKALRDLVLERFGPTIMLKPKIVVELEFDEIQQNSRTKAGFSLRFPRFKRIRWDLGPADTDTIEVVKQRWEQRISGRANTPETARLLGI